MSSRYFLSYLRQYYTPAKAYASRANFSRLSPQCQAGRRSDNLAQFNQKCPYLRKFKQIRENSRKFEQTATKFDQISREEQFFVRGGRKFKPYETATLNVRAWFAKNNSVKLSGQTIEIGRAHV